MRGTKKLVSGLCANLAARLHRDGWQSGRHWEILLHSKSIMADAVAVVYQRIWDLNLPLSKIHLMYDFYFCISCTHRCCYLTECLFYLGQNLTPKWLNYIASSLLLRPNHLFVTKMKNKNVLMARYSLGYFFFLLHCSILNNIFLLNEEKKPESTVVLKCNITIHHETADVVSLRLRYPIFFKFYLFI